jgi:DeoR family transcriptional regulator, suf operon transcriptional repressor
MTTGTRDKVLRTLLVHPRRTINELADEVGISPISIRHHISSLMAEGLISSDEERHGVGRPRQMFLLTESGVEQFPTRYVRLTIRLLEQLKETMPAIMVKQLFIQMAQELAKDLAADADTHSLSMEERLDLVKTILQREGFTIEWEQQGEQYLIREVSCPYYHVGQDHPEVCAVDQILISTMLASPASKTKCILNGDSHCTYVVTEPLSLENHL